MLVNFFLAILLYMSLITFKDNWSALCGSYPAPNALALFRDNASIKKMPGNFAEFISLQPTVFEAMCEFLDETFPLLNITPSNLSAFEKNSFLVSRKRIEHSLRLWLLYDIKPNLQEVHRSNITIEWLGQKREIKHTDQIFSFNDYVISGNACNSKILHDLILQFGKCV